MQFHESLTPRNASSTASADPLAPNVKATCTDAGRRPAFTVWVVAVSTSGTPRPGAAGAAEAGGSGGSGSDGQDRGLADPLVSAALTAFGSGVGSEHAALTALAGSRLLVPIIAVAGQGDGEEPAPGQPAHGDRDTEISLPTVIGRDGRPAIPAFTGLDTLARWRREARPVPSPASQVCRAAVDDECAVVVDIAGPVPIAIDGARLAALADGQPLPLPHEDPDVLAAVQAAVVQTAAVQAAVVQAAVVQTAAGGQQAVTGFRLAAGQDGNDLQILVTLGPDGPPEAASETIRLLGAAVMAALGGRLRRGIAIAVTPPAGPRAPRPPEPARRSWHPGWRRRGRP
jgi:hypothetical protein